MLPTSANAVMYPWKGDTNIEVSIINRIEMPHGYVRVNVTSGSFAEWLRHLPLKADGSLVYL